MCLRLERPYFQVYIGCGLGISQIGFVMTSFGVTDAICSLVFGPLMKLFGRMPLFVFGAVINMLMIMTLLVSLKIILGYNLKTKGEISL